MGLGHWLLHVTGLDVPPSRPYDFWSGIGGHSIVAVGFLVNAAVYAWHHNCHTPHCPRLGHPVNGVVTCRRHRHLLP